MRVKDKNGNIIPGLLRDESHALVVSDKEGYRRYILEKERVEKINSLEAQVKYLDAIVNNLLASKT